MSTKFTAGQTVYANQSTVFEGQDLDGYVAPDFDTSRALTVRGTESYNGNIRVLDSNGLSQWVHKSFLSEYPRGGSDIAGMTAEEKAAIIALAERLKASCPVDGYEFDTDMERPLAEGDLVLILDYPTFCGGTEAAPRLVREHAGQVVRVWTVEDSDGDVKVETQTGRRLNYVHKGSVKRVLRSGADLIPEGYKASTKAGRIQMGEFLLVKENPHRAVRWGDISGSIQDRVGQVVRAEEQENFDGEVYLEELGGEGLGWVAADSVIRLEKEFRPVKMTKARDTLRGYDVILLSDHVDGDGDVQVLRPSGLIGYTNIGELTFAEGHEDQEPVL